MYKKDVEPNLKPGAALAFAHGFNIHYGYIKLSEDHPVFMVALMGLGHRVVSTPLAGVPVSWPSSRIRWQTAAVPGLRQALALRAGAIKTTFTEETETDLFGEQDVLMGGINHCAIWASRSSLTLATSRRSLTSRSATS